jgi:hypothetical protein
MKSTKACALAVAGESRLEVMLNLFFVAYSRINTVGVFLQLRGIIESGLANIEDLYNLEIALQAG